MRKASYSRFGISFHRIEYKVDIIIKQSLGKIDKIIVGDIYDVNKNNKITKFPFVTLANIFINKLIAFSKKYESNIKSDSERKRLVRHIYDIYEISKFIGVDQIKNWMKHYDDYLKLDGCKHLSLKENILFSKYKLIENGLRVQINDLLSHELILNNRLTKTIWMS